MNLSMNPEFKLRKAMVKDKDQPKAIVGRFFSLQNGRVGQYLSPRVLVVRQPFRSDPNDLHCFGFEQAKAAAHFAKHLAYRGYSYELLLNGWTDQPYEIQVSLPLQNAKLLTQTLAFWDRQQT